MSHVKIFHKFSSSQQYTCISSAVCKIPYYYLYTCICRIRYCFYILPKVTIYRPRSSLSVRIHLLFRKKTVRQPCVSRHFTSPSTQGTCRWSLMMKEIYCVTTETPYYQMPVQLKVRQLQRHKTASAFFWVSDFY